MRAEANNLDPIVRIVKRTKFTKWNPWVVRLIAVVASLVVCAGLIYAIVGLNPLDVYASMFRGAFGTENRVWYTVRDTMMLLCIGVGLAPAFKMRFWNLGAEGQILVGGIATAACMIYLAPVLPTWLLFVVMVIASMLAGALWGLVPTVFKAKWNTNEVLFTLMMNYVAIQLTSFFVAMWENPYGSNSVGIINPQTRAGWFPALFGQNYVLNVLIVMVLTIGMFVYLKYSKQGYEIAVVGESERTARYAGIPVERVYLRTMLVSAAICGLAGFIAVSGASHTISVNTADGRGFTAIIVAWMAKFNTLYMIAISLLLVFFDKGAIQIASDFGLNDYASEMITGIILFFLIGSEFFINYRLVFRGRKTKEAKA